MSNRLTPQSTTYEYLQQLRNVVEEVFEARYYDAFCPFIPRSACRDTRDLIKTIRAQLTELENNIDYVEKKHGQLS